MAILPVSLCRCTVSNLFLCFPFGKCLFAVFAFVVLLNYRKQTPCQRFKDVFRNFGCIHAVWDIRFSAFTWYLLYRFCRTFRRIRGRSQKKIFPCVFSALVGRKTPCFRPLFVRYCAILFWLNQLCVRWVVQRNEEIGRAHV